ncbi:LOW QUALITY PROTEIN: L-carnitine dehydratase/bile acid-inducible protein F, partial [Rhodococcus opacus PD630]
MTLQSTPTAFAPEAADDRQPGRPHQDAFGRNASGPLAGIVVADFSRVLAGPYCTMLLADMGATVIKVEGPSGDETRAWKPPVFDGQSTYYLSINRNKRSIALDFGDPDDLETARGIAESADVVVENFKPGGLDRFGLDYASIAERNPAVVYASITGFGSAGGAALPGYDLLVQAMSGMMSLTGDPDLPAYRSGVAVFDVITGLHAAIGVLSALHERGRSGRGQRIGVNLMSSALSGMSIRPPGSCSAGMCPPEWVTSIPASILTSRCPPRTATSSWPSATTGNSGLCATSSVCPSWRRTPGLRHHRTAATTVRRCAPSCRNCWPPSPRPNGSTSSPRHGCRVPRSTMSAAESNSRSASGWNPSWRWATAKDLFPGCATRSHSRRRRPATTSCRPASTPTGVTSSSGCTRPLLGS